MDSTSTQHTSTSNLFLRCITIPLLDDFTERPTVEEFQSIENFPWHFYFAFWSFSIRSIFGKHDVQVCSFTIETEIMFLSKSL